MAYTSVAGRFVKPFLRSYNFRFIKKVYKKNRDISASLGLIGPGILKTERAYKNVSEFKKDLRDTNRIGIKNIAVYSIDSVMRRKNPKVWLAALQAYIQSPQSHQSRSP
jgi:hypothetical protein